MEEAVAINTRRLCNKCGTFRLSVRCNSTSKPVIFLAQDSDDFTTILERLCTEYPTIWQMDVVYYFYVDMSGFYYSLDDPAWLRDKDAIVVTEIADLEDLPKINLNAVHASFRNDVRLQPHQVEGVDNMIYMEKAYRGGILADEMGLGKTVQTLAVVLRQQPVINTWACTLIVVPSRGIADQWAEEIRSKTTYGSLPYFIYQDDSIALLEQPCFRVVITTYDRVRAEYKRNDVSTPENNKQQTIDSPLFEINWHRVVLDESHKVRGGTMLFHSVNALKAKYRWCLSGTPFQNDITELYPIFTFLRIPMDVKKRREDDYMKDLLKEHMIRRTKSALHTELTILPRQEKRVVLEFTKPERALYEYLERLLYHQLTRFKESGDGNSLLTSSAILYLRLKQVCGHHMILLEKFPDLIPLARKGQSSTIASSIEGMEIQREKNYYDETSEFEQALEIIESYYDQFGNLQEPIDLSQLQKLNFIKHSTKVTWLVKFLQDLMRVNTTEKIVVVSQFVDVIIKISDILTNTRIPFQTYHGGMSIYSRKCALQQFNHDPKVRVLVMSLKAGGVGLNLQRANHMIIMDRWWNPATMDQAIARIHRMTQEKETFIHTVVVKDTIEETLMDNILNKKYALFQKIVERHEQKIDNQQTKNLYIQNTQQPSQPPLYIRDNESLLAQMEPEEVKPSTEIISEDSESEDEHMKQENIKDEFVVKKEEQMRSLHEFEDQVLYSGDEDEDREMMLTQIQLKKETKTMKRSLEENAFLNRVEKEKSYIEAFLDAAYPQKKKKPPVRPSKKRSSN